MLKTRDRTLRETKIAQQKPGIGHQERNNALDKMVQSQELFRRFCKRPTLSCARGNKQSVSADLLWGRSVSPSKRVIKATNKFLKNCVQDLYTCRLQFTLIVSRANLTYVLMGLIVGWENVKRPYEFIQAR
jgi:hypothetical protein